MEHQEKKRTGMSGFMKFLLIVLSFVLLSFALQLGGIKVMNVNQEDTLIENPHRNRR